ncbi:hypothetical protein [Roseomonas chloroacetimidivorans]
MWHSIAAGCAAVFAAADARLAATYLNEKAESFVRPGSAANWCSM